MIDLIDEGDPEDELERWEQDLKDRNAYEKALPLGNRAMIDQLGISISAGVRYARVNANISRDQIARVLGCSPSTIQGYESMNPVPSREYIIWLGSYIQKNTP